MMVLTGILFYYLIAVFWIRRATKNDPTALSTLQIALTLGFKIALGCLYGYIFLIKYDGDDTWLLHQFSLEQHELLKSDPLKFFSEMNPVVAFDRYDDLQTNIYYYLSDLEAWFFGKPFAFINFLSGGNYYVNIVFFNAIVFWGHYWLYKLLISRLSLPPLPLLVCIFFIPPVIFWLSGLRAEGPLLFFISLSLYHYDRLLKKPGFSSVLLVLISFAGILILRSAILFILIPALVSWLLVVRKNTRPLLAFAAVYGFCATVFFGSSILFPEKGLTSLVVNRQKEFFELEGNTRFQLDTLSGNAMSFAKVFPQAVNNVFLRPYPWEAKGALQYGAVLEVMLFLVLFLMFMYKKVQGWKSILNDPLTLLLLSFAFCLYVLTGYTVPFPGAIVRYKIIGELFLLISLVVCIDWNAITKKGGPSH